MTDMKCTVMMFESRARPAGGESVPHQPVPDGSDFTMLERLAASDAYLAGQGCLTWLRASVASLTVKP